MEPSTPAPQLRDLSTQSPWLRRLARSLVRDEHEAEDLFQSTWLAALRRPAREPGPSGSWLAQVMRNLAREHWRTDRRREAREARREHGDAAQADAAEIVSRLELATLVSRCVLELEEPERSTVLLHYHAGLTCAQIAREHDVPAATVRSRLKRALARMRARLDQQHPGGREAWSLALGALASPRRSAGALAASISVVALAGALAAGVAALKAKGPLQRPSTLAAQDALPGANALVTAREAAVAERAAVHSRAQEFEASGSPRIPPAQTRISGRLVDERGAPLRGALVASTWGREVDQGAESSALGDFELLLESDRWSVFSDRPAVRGVTLRITHSSCETLEQRVDRPVDADNVSLGVVALRPGGAVSGIVLDEFGDPAGDAEVFIVEAGTSERRLRASFGGARTDSAGRFELAGLAIGHWTVAARAANGALGVSDPFVLAAGDHLRALEIRLSPALHAWRVRAYAPDGEPMAHAQLHVRLEDEFGAVWKSVQLDGRGEGQLVARGADSSEQRWSASEHPFDELTIGTNALRREEIELRFAPAAPLEIVVAGGVRPLTLVARPLHGESFTDTGLAGPPDAVHHRSLQPSSSGRLQIPQPMWPFELFVTAPGHAAWRSGPMARGPARFEITLAKAPGLSGRVLANGAPLAGANVTLLTRLDLVCDDCEDLRDYHSDQSVRTDESGAFHFAVRQSRPTTLTFEADGLAPASCLLDRIDPQLGRSGIEVELLPGGGLRGRAFDERGEPLAGQVVAALHAEGLFRRWTRSNGAGEFELTALSPGAWRVRTLSSAPDRSNWPRWRADDAGFDLSSAVEVRVREGVVSQIDLVRPPPARLVGVLRVDGKPPQGAWRLRHDLRMLALLRDSPSIAASPIAADGSIELATSTFDGGPLQLEGPGVALELRPSLSPGVTTRLAIDLRFGAVVGRSLRKPRRYERLYARGSWDELALNQCVELDSDGAFELRFVPVGALRLVWDTDDDSDGEVDGLELTVEAGRTTRVSLH